MKKQKRIKHGKLRNLRIADRQFKQLCEPNKKFRRRNFNKALIKRLKSEGIWPVKIDYLFEMLQEGIKCPVGPTGEIGPIDASDDTSAQEEAGPQEPIEEKI